MRLRVANEEIARLRNLNDDLVEHLEKERKASLKARDDVIKNVSSLLVDFAKERDQSLRNAVASVTDESNEAEKALSSFKNEQTAFVNDAVKRTEEFDDDIMQRSKETLESRDSAIMALDDAESTLRANLQKTSFSVSEAIGLQTEHATKQEQLLASSVPEFERERKAKRARVQAINEISAETQSTLEGSIVFNDEMAAVVNDYSADVSIESRALLKRSEEFAASSTSRISQIRQQNGTIFKESSKDIPVTGSTPRKRKWQYVDKWERTRARDELLGEFRLQRGERVASPAESAYDSHSQRAPSQMSDVPSIEERGEDNAANSDAASVDVKVEEVELMQSTRTTSTTMSMSENSDPSSFGAPAAQPSKLAKLKAPDSGKTAAGSRLLRDRPTNIVDARANAKRKR